MVGADTGLSLKRLQSLRFFVMLVDRVADAADQFNAGIGRGDAVRVTTLAGAKALALSGFGKLEKAYLLGPRPARRT